MEKNYYVGFDIGTDSVGYAVTDENYNLLRLKGKTAWGVRLFDQASTAVERRQFRANRRRHERREERMKLLRGLFANQMHELDPSFFLRLDNSNFQEDDKALKNVQGKYSLFFDDGFTDKEFYKQYPTIYHLRHELMVNPEKHDLRLVYLAVHHILKYRGNFLTKGELNSEENNLSALLNELNNTIVSFSENDESGFFEPIPNINEINLKLEEIAKKKDVSKSKKVEEMLTEIGVTKNDFQKLIFKAVLGLKVDLHKLFHNDEYKELDLKQLEFSDTYDEKKDVLEEQLGTDFELVEKLYVLYQYFARFAILGNHQTLSEAMVEKFETHKKQLKMFKAYIKTHYGKDVYFNLFKKVEKVKEQKEEDVEQEEKELKNKAKLNNYPAYIGMAKVKKQKMSVKKCNQEDFYKFVEAVLENASETAKADPRHEQILQAIKNETFLPKQLSKENAAIPYQLNKNELETILNNASKHYPFLNQADKYGTVSNKIVQILTFRVPFFVGPLNTKKDEKHAYAWAEVQPQTKVTPWNHEDLVSYEKSYEGFISKLINQCSKLHEYPVLPRQSFVYNEYLVLNELNAIRVDGQKLEPTVKQNAFNELFKEKKTVGTKDFKNWLLQEKVIESEHATIEGFMSGENKKPDSKKFAHFLDSYHALKTIVPHLVNDHVAQCEEIVRLITMYGGNDTGKKLLATSLKKMNNLTSDQVQALCKLKFKDWARFSSEFLTQNLFTIKQTGELVSIMQLLRETQQTLSEIESNPNYNVQEVLQEGNHKKNETLTYEAVQELYCSPSVKRPVWQTLQMLNEIIAITGNKPSKIFVEVTRSNQAEKKQTVKRKDTILSYYKEKLDEKLVTVDEVNKLKEKLNGKSDADLRDEKLFLYFMQFGKCAYSGRPINNLLELGTNYDVDHIIPRALLKDDSFSNKVLVEQQLNKNKADSYPLSVEVQTKMKPFWEMLRKRNMMSATKFERLTRTTPLKEEELKQFVNRQIVETSQSNLAVIELIKTYYGDENTEIIYSKAENVTDFRSKFELTKVREINDHHHAKDAYINIVVGNVLKEFSKDFFKSYRHDKIVKYGYNEQGLYTYEGLNLDKIFENSVINKNNQTVWNGKNSVTSIENNYYRDDVLVSKMPLEGKGVFYNMVAVPHKAGLLPIKTNDPRYLKTEIYGGYNSANTAYFFVFKHVNKGKTIVKLEGLPIYFENKIKQGNYSLIQYCKEQIGIENCEIVVPKIKKYAELEKDGFRYYITGQNEKQLSLHNATQLKLDKHIVKLLKPMSEFYKIYNSLAKEQKDKLTLPDRLKFDKKNKDKIKLSNETANIVFDELIRKLSISPLNNIFQKAYENLLKVKEKFYDLTLENKCIQIIRILLMTSCNAALGDYSLLGGSKLNGKLQPGKNITDSTVYLINKSVTGLIETKTLIHKATK